MGSRLLQNSEAVRKRIESHSFQNEEGEEYEGSKFNGFSDYFRRKKIKLQNQDAEVRSASSDKPQIFRGIVAHVNGYTQPSLNDLHYLIVSHGGGFMQYLDGKTTVTHIIASNLTPKKAVEFRRYRIVKPAWIVDSVKAGRVLPWDSYKVIDEGTGQRLLGFDDGKMISQTNTPQRTYKEQTSTSWYTGQVKSVAEDIDDEVGAQFPSTQRVASNGTVAYMGDTLNKPKQWAPKSLSQRSEMSEQFSSSAHFEVSSSFEDALNSAAKHVDSGKKGTKADQVILEEPSVLSSTKADQKIHEEPMEDEARLTSPQDEQLKEEYKLTSLEKGKELTAEEHNARLLSDPHLRKSSTANPDFIRHYYAESRLHHLSTWKADLKARFQQMAAEKTASQAKPQKRKPGARRYVMHVDFDSFFCAVSLLGAPEFKDKPTVVAHGSGPGSEIASCNYPARAFGIKNGMWMKKALELCSNIKVLPYDFTAYEEASKHFYECIIDVGGVVQSVSIDEALVDITALCLPAGGSDGLGISEGSIWREQEQADKIATALRERIKETTGCAVSIGIGGNILLAKVALRKAKPAGQYHIKPEEILDFIGALSVQDLPGVAWSIGGKLEEAGVKLVKDVRELTKERLMTILGPKTGEKIWDYSRGIDRTEVGEQAVRKSVSAEVNWGIRFISQPEAEEFVMNLCKELQRRLIEQRVRGRQLTMKIMRRAADAPLDPPKNLGHGKCDTFNKSVVLGVPTNNAEIIGKEAISILRGYGFSPGELRGLGVQMQKLEQLKASSNAQPDGSQRKINFGTSNPPRLAKQITEDPIDDPETPTKPKPVYQSPSKHTDVIIDSITEVKTPQKTQSSVTSRVFDRDGMDDIDSPRKIKNAPIPAASAITRANASDQSAKKLLNLTGTQFIIPSQLDPTVLSELPLDIRSKLLAQSKSRSTSRSASPAVRSRSPSHGPADQILPSQLDPDVFAALPEEMKAEVLASCKSRSHHPANKLQSPLPQSPRKPKPAPLVPPKRATPTKRRGRPPGSRNKATLEAHSGFKQSSFATGKAQPAPSNNALDGDADDGDLSDVPLDEEFLAALPPDMRAEVVAEHRRNRLLRKGVILTASSGPSRKEANPAQDPNYQCTLRLPPREPRPTFTTMELSTLEELREAMETWFTEFREEGPLDGDVGAVERYLRRVVTDERDVAKAVGVVKWLEWLKSEAQDVSHRGKESIYDDNENDDRDEGLRNWKKALDGIKSKVQDAVRERGLGRLDL